MASEIEPNGPTLAPVELVCLGEKRGLFQEGEIFLSAGGDEQFCGRPVEFVGDERAVVVAAAVTRDVPGEDPGVGYGQPARRIQRLADSGLRRRGRSLPKCGRIGRQSLPG